MPASLLAVTKLGKLAGLHACVTPLAVKFSLSIIITGSQIGYVGGVLFAKVEGHIIDLQGCTSCILHIYYIHNSYGCSRL